MRSIRVSGVTALLLVAGCTSDASTPPLAPPSFSIVAATPLVVTDEASCNALPVSTTWTAPNNCALDEDLTLTSGGSLHIENVRVVVPSGVTLTNSGGSTTVVLGGLLRIQGTLANTGGGSITNSGFWDLRNGGVVTNDAGSTIATGNQLFVTQGTLTNNGSLTNTGLLGISGSLFNPGTLDNAGTVKLENGTFDNSGTIHNNGTIDIGCSTGFSNSGTITGNAVVQPYCWVGGNGAAWSDPSNWNRGATPPSAGPIVLEFLGGGGPTLDASFTLTGTMTMQLATLTIGPGVELTNEGTLTLGKGGQLPGTTRIVNLGTLTNAPAGALQNNDLIVNHGTLVNHGALVPSVATGVVENYAQFTNASDGAFTGGLTGHSTGTFENQGHVDLNRITNSNAGLVANGAGAVFNANNELANETGGRIENDGTLNITHELNFPASIDNATGATIVNRGHLSLTASDAALNNSGLVENPGTVDNGGVIQNDGVICGPGAINGNPVSGNAPTPTCNRAPTASLGGPYVGQEGVPITLSLGGSDPDGQSLTFTWDLGDGTTGSGGAPPSQHTYGDNPVLPATAYTITLTVDDGAGGTDTKTTTATVSNVAPTATFAPPASVDEGGTFTLTLTGVQDVAADLPTLQRRFDCGTGFGSWSTATSRVCPAVDDATLPVAAEIRDKDGGSSSYSGSVTVVNVAPSLGAITLPADPIPVGTTVSISATFTDPGTVDTHTGFVRWNPGGSLDPASPGVDDGAHTLTAEAALPPGVYQPELVVRDDDGGEDSRLADAVVVVYDPDGGFLSGGGWFTSPSGALAADPAAGGKGHFNFDAQYQGADAPEGYVTFDLPSAGLAFASTSLSWMVVTPGVAKVEGEGTVGGVPGYGFRVTAVDRGQPGRSHDGARVRIWRLDTGTTVYDNQAGEAPESEATTLLGGGNILVHR